MKKGKLNSEALSVNSFDVSFLFCLLYPVRFENSLPLLFFCLKCLIVAPKKNFSIAASIFQRSKIQADVKKTSTSIEANKI